MRFATFRSGNETGLAIADDKSLRGHVATGPGFPGTLVELIAKGSEALRHAYAALKTAPLLDPEEISFLPPLPVPGKIICLGLNYADHAREGGFNAPSFPAFFVRFASSLVGHNAPIIRPVVSDKLDYEGEMVAVIGRGGRHISKAEALDHVAGYSIFNDASIRDYQMKTPQWTIGKNFDATGGFGPFFVTADEVPPGAKGLQLQTRLNGKLMQNASTADMIFDVAETIVILSQAMTLVPGDVIVTGTPAGVGFARTPPLFMKAGDVCEVEIQGLGILRNPIAAE